VATRGARLIGEPNFGVVERGRSETATAPRDLRPRHGLRELVAAVPAAIWLGVVVAASACLRYALALNDPAPWIFPDEWIYSELARSFASSGHFEVWSSDWPVRTFGPLYPTLISPAYALSESLPQAYEIVKAFNALAMSLAAVPAYLLARRLAGRRLSLFVAVLVVLVPSMVYTTKVMTENVAYPIFLFAALAIMRALEKASSGRQVAALGMLVTAFLTRGEMLVMVPVYFSAIFLAATLDTRAEDERLRPSRVIGRLSAYKTSWTIASAGLVLFVAAALLRSPSGLFGAHERLIGQIRLTAAPRWFLYHVAELDLAVGIIPFAAFLVVTVLVFTERASSRSARLYIAFSLAAFFWFMTLAALYGTQPRAHPHVFERYVFYVMPLFFMALAFWMQRGLPRPRPWAGAAALVAVLLPALLPYGMLLNGREWGVSSSTPGLVIWGLLRHQIGTGVLMITAVLVFGSLFAGLFLIVRPEGKHRLMLAVVLNLCAISVSVALANVVISRVAGVFQNQAQLGWIDEFLGPDARVAALWSGERIKNKEYALLEDQFFNKSVRVVYDLREPIKDGIPSRPLNLRGRTLVYRSGPAAGRPMVVDYLLADPSVGVAASAIATNPDNHLVLYRVGGRVRLTAIGVRRFHSDGE
jgi:Dolichyl-phosphate-mannose-protein mannosyltransferase